MERVLCVLGAPLIAPGLLQSPLALCHKRKSATKGRYLHCKDIWRLPPPGHQFTLTRPVSRHQRSHARSVGGRKWWLCVHLCVTSGLACGEVGRTSPGPAAGLVLKNVEWSNCPFLLNCSSLLSQAFWMLMKSTCPASPWHSALWSY